MTYYKYLDPYSHPDDRESPPEAAVDQTIRELCTFRADVQKWSGMFGTKLDKQIEELVSVIEEALEHTKSVRDF